MKSFVILVKSGVKVSLSFDNKHACRFMQFSWIPLVLDLEFLLRGWIICSRHTLKVKMTLYAFTGLTLLIFFHPFLQSTKINIKFSLSNCTLIIRIADLPSIIFVEYLVLLNYIFDIEFTMTNLSSTS